MGRWNKRVKEARKKQDSDPAALNGGVVPTSTTNRRGILYLIAIFASVAAFPFIMVFSTGFDVYVDDFAAVIWKGFEQLFSFVQLFALFFTLVAIVLTSISAALLFEFEFGKSITEGWKDRWYWKFLKHFDLKHKRRVWHLFLGYFIAVSALTPIVGGGIFNTQTEDQIFTEYEAHLFAIMTVPIALLIGRIASKLDIQIVDTNLGFFVVVLFLGLMMFEIMANGSVPFIHYLGIFAENPLDLRLEKGGGVNGGIALYLSTIIECSIITAIDVAIMKRMSKNLPKEFRSL